MCTVPAHPGAQLDPRARGTAFYMVYVSEDPSFTNLLEPTTAIPATTNTIYMPALDNRDWTYADNQTERPLLLVRAPLPGRRPVRPRPGRRVGLRADDVLQEVAAGHRDCGAASPPKTEVTFTWDDYLHDPASTSHRRHVGADR